MLIFTSYTAETSSMHILQQDQKYLLTLTLTQGSYRSSYTAGCMRWSPGPCIPTSDQMADTSPRVSAVSSSM